MVAAWIPHDKGVVFVRLVLPSCFPDKQQPTRWRRSKSEEREEEGTQYTDLPLILYKMGNNVTFFLFFSHSDYGGKINELKQGHDFR